MTKVGCRKGHIYDSDIYSSCPYCNNFQTVDFNGMPVGQGGNTMPGSGMQRSVTEKGATLPPRGYGMRVDAEIKTTGKMKNERGIEPVVGWLVCIEGKDEGKDYHLYGRINTIGRSENMDVYIHGDSGITRDTHFKIGYDPKKNLFHVIPGNGTNNIYVNDEPVYMQTRLNAYDLIEVSETKLVFIPLCGQQFTWSGGLNRKGGDDALI